MNVIALALLQKGVAGIAGIFALSSLAVTLLSLRAKSKGREISPDSMLSVTAIASLGAALFFAFMMILILNIPEEDFDENGHAVISEFNNV